MRKIITGLAILILCLYSATVYSMPGRAQTAYQEAGDWLVGLGDSERDEEGLGIEVLTRKLKEKKEVKISRLVYDQTYGLTENLDFYLVFGLSETKLKNEDANSTNFLYGLGLKGVYPMNNWFVGTDLSYLSQGKTSQEWQVTPYVGKKFGNLIPYIGVRCSNLTVKGSESDSKLGLCVGMDYRINDSLFYNIGGRFINELAINGSVTFKLW